EIVARSLCSAVASAATAATTASKTAASSSAAKATAAKTPTRTSAPGTASTLPLAAPSAALSVRIVRIVAGWLILTFGGRHIGLLCRTTLCQPSGGTTKRKRFGDTQIDIEQTWIDRMDAVWIVSL